MSKRRLWVVEVQGDSGWDFCWASRDERLAGERAIQEEKWWPNVRVVPYVPERSR